MNMVPSINKRFVAYQKGAAGQKINLFCKIIDKISIILSSKTIYLEKILKKHDNSQQNGIEASLLFPVLFNPCYFFYLLVEAFPFEA